MAAEEVHGVGALEPRWEGSAASHAGAADTRHPFDVSGHVVEAALLNPNWGFQRLAEHLRSEGLSVSAAAVREALTRQCLGQRCARVERLELMHQHEGLPLTARQVRVLEKANPSFRERYLESGRPGELIAQESFLVGRIEGIGKVYLHSAVDTFGSFAFAAVRPTKRTACAVALLDEDVLPFYRMRGIRIGAVMTDNGREFCGNDAHQFALYLADNGIEHYRTEAGTSSINGFVERFHQTIVVEFFSLTSRRRRYGSMAELQADLSAWLRHYNYDRPHSGYRNFGKPPAEFHGWRPCERSGAAITP